jgi:hypothetical protein
MSDKPPALFDILADQLTPINCDNPHACGSRWEWVGGSIVECATCGGQGVLDREPPRESPPRRVLQ